MKIFKSEDKEFRENLNAILRRGEDDLALVEDVVREILKGVKEGGDSVLLEYTKRFDGIIPDSLLVSEKEIEKATEAIPQELLDALNLASQRIEAFHRRHIPQSWFTSEEGILLGQKVTPLLRVGIYVPGGKALYPSSILMNAIPAKIAGVNEVIMVTPPFKEGISPSLLTAAKIAGVDRVYQVGGAQAVAALAYGTETIPAVDKVVGPGNIYVAAAKRLVYGTVDIDMVAGPSEILIINDGAGNPAYIASDLLSQSEHDEVAISLLLTTSEEMASRVKEEVSKRLEGIKRKDIALKALEKQGAIIVVKDLGEAVDLSNEIAPEHLELLVEDPLSLLGHIRNAGAIFLGEDTPEPIGDYIAGPNHVLPTGGTARFSSPLGVEDFLKRSSVISFSHEAIKRLGRYAITMAYTEGLDAHAKAIEVRLKTHAEGGQQPAPLG